MLQVTNLSKYYGERCLFAEATFSLQPRERAGLIGRNGHGKSTLFRILIGQEEQDEGTITTPKGYEIGYLAQVYNFSAPTLLEETCRGLRPEYQDEAYRAERVLMGLGFSEADFMQPPSSFSGGYQLRINLAKLFLSEPHLLLLDEPTNYLDILSVRWLVEELRSWPRECIIISHDRGFLDSVTTHTLGIYRRTIRKIPGNAAKLENLLAEEEEIHERTRVNQLKKREETEAFIRRFRAKASKASLVQSRIKQLEKMPEISEISVEQTLSFAFSERPTHAKFLIEAKGLSFAYPDSPLLFKDFSLALKPCDRLGIIGRNGLGKSTLLKLLGGIHPPRSGEIVEHSTLSRGYFAQTNVADLSADLTIEQEIRQVDPTLSTSRIRGICGMMMFSGDDALKRISALSGGERSRVALGKIIARPSNVLLLDEPTSHLDLESVDALIEALCEYKGVVIIVSHSEMLLKTVTTRLVVFQSGGPSLFEGNYEDFLRERGWEEEHQVRTSPSKRSQVADDRSSSVPKKDSSKEIRKLEKEQRQLEALFSKLDESQKMLEQDLCSLSAGGDYAAAQKIADKRQIIEQQIMETLEKIEQIESKRSSLV
jgi:ATP-binding cassette, subfamily F, member 3